MASASPEDPLASAATAIATATATTAANANTPGAGVADTDNVADMVADKVVDKVVDKTMDMPDSVSVSGSEPDSDPEPDHSDTTSAAPSEVPHQDPPSPYQYNHSPEDDQDRPLSSPGTPPIPLARSQTFETVSNHHRPLPLSLSHSSFPSATSNPIVKRKPLSSTASVLALRSSSASIVDLPKPDQRFARAFTVDSPTLYEYPSSVRVSPSPPSQ